MATDFYPVGAVIAYGGDLEVNDNWLFCDGRELNCGDYPELFSAIEYIYGGDVSGHKFKLPDYRGRFLRGAVHTANADPDAASRTSLAPSGFTADIKNPGSIQDYATKRPNKHFTAKFPHLPTDKKDSHGETAPNNIGPSGSDDKATCTSGGDKESRPKNVYVNYYIKTRN